MEVRTWIILKKINIIIMFESAPFNLGKLLEVILKSTKFEDLYTISNKNEDIVKYKENESLIAL